MILERIGKELAGIKPDCSRCSSENVRAEEVEVNAIRWHCKSCGNRYFGYISDPKRIMKLLVDARKELAQGSLL